MNVYLLANDWSAVVAFIGDKLVGLRVQEEQECEGLDINSHGENTDHG
ncbi:hypothetical protein HV213_11000 [Klebsiella sp. RHBSTW-00484]|nr:hypothetical protein [Klebsiella sp. RHBSTW-00465]QLO34322.1 hypothetical protein HV213_11000 [Klebsiella sp. RHBSTW-00484]QLT73836.1 hypothetical protein HV204_11000 [Klebsiella sp. RHBSTW-00464]